MFPAAAFRRLTQVAITRSSRLIETDNHEDTNFSSTSTSYTQAPRIALSYDQQRTRNDRNFFQDISPTTSVDASISGIGLAALLPFAISSDDIHRTREEINPVVTRTREDAQLVDQLFKVIEDPSIQRAFGSSKVFQDLVARTKMPNHRQIDSSSSMPSLKSPDHSNKTNFAEGPTEEEVKTILMHCARCAQEIGNSPIKIESSQGCGGSVPESYSVPRGVTIAGVIIALMLGLVLVRDRVGSGHRFIEGVLMVFLRGEAHV